MLNTQGGESIMQINQVEQETGVTKKNIRFYEQQGLLNPARQEGNGYRDYSPEDVAVLLRIKLLRKLDVPLSEIRTMLEGKMTLADGMRRHQVVLESRQKDLENAMQLTQALGHIGGRLADLNASEPLEQIIALEKKGVCFVDVTKKDKTKKYRGAVLAASLLLAGVLLFEALMIWGIMQDAPPLPLAVLIVALPLILAAGVLAALKQRMKEIKGGEEDAADQY